MTATTFNSDSDASSHDYAGLENADANPATWIDFREIPADEDFDSSTDWSKTHKRTYWKRLDDHNKGHVNGDRRNQRFYTYQSNLHLCQAYSGRLELTSREVARAKKWFLRLDFDELGHSVQLSALCICAYLVHNDDRDERECHPQTPPHKWPDEFREVIVNWNEEWWRLLDKVYGQVRHSIESWTAGDSERVNEQMNQYQIHDIHLGQ